MKAVIMAGGTGGHVYPALAVATELQRRGHTVTWMGTPDSFESRVVPQRGIPLELIRIAGLRGKGVVRWLQAPFRLWRGLLDARGVLKRQRPQVVLGMGGFAAGPGGLMAWLSRIPLVIHEQNAVAGMTNRWLAHVATVALEAFPRALAGGRTVGNPVRADIAGLPGPAQRLAERSGAMRLLVLGGSLGAKALNERVPQALARLPAAARPEVRHQGGRTVEVARAAYRAAGVVADVAPFIDDMAGAYAWADLVVCRAGASTIAELAAAGCASLLVPYPYAVDDHQTRNAEYLVAVGAAELVQEANLPTEALAQRLARLLADRPRLVAMAIAARGASWPETAAVIADTCERCAAAKGRE
ncbi:MAG TPA: undecaprenyldiphospho-muramoylpentapeptide beta-N-acetylglucosaminyltransferase [Nevskiaceae bacterium]|nr:undecaprenyldiphospho-muramoylpentapeptide beta-N-acetylglucosaminyltransferase [Nevskiaceae bacterium]